MFNLKNRYPIGIDITDQNIYAAQFQETRQGISIRELCHLELNNGQTHGTEPYDTLIPALKEIAKNKRFRGKTVSIHLPARLIYRFPITFEIGDGETIEDAMVRECRRNLSFPLEEAIIDYPSFIDMSSGKNKKIKAIIIAVRRDQVEEYIHLLKRAGLWVEAIDLDLSSLLRLHDYLYSMKEKTLILCNIGYHQSLIAVVSQNSILAQRHTPWGIQHLLNRLETNLELSGNREQALAMLNKYGLYYEHHIGVDGDGYVQENRDKDEAMEIYRTVFQILNPYVDGLIHEFYQITGHVRSELQSVKFEEIFIYGQAISINFMDRYLEKKLNIPTTCINPMEKLTLIDSSLLADLADGAPFSLALGLALRNVPWL
ncbi:MAG: pilus assembly protein PilM [Desulfobacterales bacterium]|jgi:type IV pilus assembly protein PilM